MPGLVEIEGNRGDTGRYRALLGPGVGFLAPIGALYARNAPGPTSEIPDPWLRAGVLGQRCTASACNGSCPEQSAGFEIAFRVDWGQNHLFASVLRVQAPLTRASSFKNLDVEAEIRGALAKTGLGVQCNNRAWSIVCQCASYRSLANTADCCESPLTCERCPSPATAENQRKGE